MGPVSQGIQLNTYLAALRASNDKVVRSSQSRSPAAYQLGSFVPAQYAVTELIGYFGKASVAIGP
jgi:hypothetical protein